MGKNSSNAFSILAGINRPIKPAQVSKLAESINTMGIIRPIVIAVLSFIDGTSKKYIIDGQHLYFALIRNNMDFPYTTIEVKDKVDLVEKIALLNNSSKSWTTIDYVTAWSAIIPDYQKLSELYNTYDIELGQIAELACKGLIQAKGKIGRIFDIIKKGQFRIESLDTTISTLNKITDTLKVVPRMDRDSNSMFIAAYTQLLVQTGTKYNHAKFMAYLKAHKQQFATVTQDPEEISKLLKKAVTGK